MGVEYKLAVEMVIHKEDKSIFEDPYLFYCKVGDLIGSSHVDNHLLKIYLEVNRKIDLYNLFTVNGLLKGRRILSDEFKKKSFNFTARDFVQAINPISKAICPVEFQQFVESKFAKDKGVSNNQLARVINNPVQVFKAPKQNNALQVGVEISKNINPPVKQIPQNHTQPNKIRRVWIYARSAQFRVKLNNTNSYSLYSIDEKRGIRSRIPIKEQNGLLRVYACDLDEVFELHLPNTCYEAITIDSSRGDVIIDNNIGPLKAKTIKVDYYSCKLELYAECNKLITYSNSGSVYLKGKYGSIETNTKGGNVWGDIEVNSRSRKHNFVITTDRGYISLGVKGLPKEFGSGLFKRNKYSDVQFINGMAVTFNLLSKRANVRLRRI